ncbi:MAG: ATP synthase F1 subunit gamma [Candidatus Levybacteria bacterium]|nr:ATP synthase F1 subunit gamma [Candidatus Levybacteria bacterium]
MATLHILKRRIKAAQNVSKTTRAMQMIAASKLKRAQEAALSSRPYVDKLTVLTQGINRKISDEQKHPYLELKKDTGKTLIILLAPDKGLCGGLITNLLREFLTLTDKEKAVSYVVVGKKAESSVIHLNTEVIASFPFGNTLPTFDMVYPIAKLIDDHYLSGKVHAVKILYTNFVSIFSQKPVTATLLPVTLPQETIEQQNTVTLFEPNFTDLIPTLLKHYLEMAIYQYLLESYVSEQASRMIAMQNATTNAKDIIADLQLEYNKSRQSKITNEILDITGSRIKSL